MLQHFLCHKTLQIVIAAAAPPPLLVSSTSSAALRVACFAYCTLPASAYSHSSSSALSLSPPMCSTFLRQFSRARQIPKPNSPKLTSTKNSAHWNMLTVTRRSRTGGEEGGERGESRPETRLQLEPRLLRFWGLGTVWPVEDLFRVGFLKAH